MHGLNLNNLFRGLPFELITHNIGNVDSIGNAIFLAGAASPSTNPHLQSAERASGLRSIVLAT